MDDVVDAAEIIATTNELWPLEPVQPNYPAKWRLVTATATATAPARWGIIASVTQPFYGA